MKVATLALVVRDVGDELEVLLARKKTGEAKKGGVGIGTYNGPGGKVEDGESLVDCTLREAWEEMHIILDSDRLEEVAVVTFHVASIPDFKVHIFRTDTFAGRPQETRYMEEPRWFRADSLPFSEMLEADQHWMPRALLGEPFCASVYNRARGAGFEHIDYSPFA